MSNHHTKLMSAAVCAALIFSMPANAKIQKNVMFVLDASNSMWGQINGKPKIEIAKAVLKNLAGEMPATAKLGLVAYGHRFDRKLNECDDMELMNPIGHFSAAEADNSFSFVTPKGQTPIARTLMETAEWLQEHKGQDNTVVLISDGVESCDGDPCEAAKALNDSGVTTKIHVVGFDLSANQRAKLECISKNGNGKMFSANDATSLAQVLSEVKDDVARTVLIPKTPKEPKPPKVEIAFEDQFDGEFLVDGWEVINPNLERYVTEDGQLLIIAGTPASDPSKEDMQNVIAHANALPKGDWEIEIIFQLEAQHGQEAFYFGVMNDFNNWMSAGVRTRQGYGEVFLESFIAKNENGQVARFDVAVDSEGDTSSRGSTKRWRKNGLGDKYSKQSFVLILKKQSRAYSLSGVYGAEGDEGFKTFQTESIKMLRGKKKLFLAFGLGSHGRDYQGEGTVLVDYVRVRSIAKQK